MPTTTEIWRKLINMNDRLYTVEARVAAIGESAERNEKAIENMTKDIHALRENYHDLRTEHKVSVAQMTLVFSLITGLGATIGGCVVKAGFDGFKAQLTQQQAPNERLR